MNKPLNKPLIGMICERILAVLGFWFIAIYVFVSLARINFPYHLEWIEGAMVDQTIRVFHHLPVYIKPNIDFIPQIYPPLYFYLSAAMMHVTGAGFLPLRLVSWVASLGFLAIIFLWVRQETQRMEFGLLAASFMAACYKLSGSWFDVARVDSLFLFFTLAAAYAVRFTKKPSGWIFAGVLIFLAWLTKQTATAVFAPLFVYVLMDDRRKAAWIFGTASVLGVLTFLWLNKASGGWYSYYLVNFAAYLTTGYTKERFIHFWTQDLLKVALLACLFVVSYVGGFVRQEKGFAKLFYFFLLAGLTFTSCLARMHWGGAENVLMPVYAGLSILLGLSAAEWIEKFHGQGHFWREQGVRVICFVQLLSLFYSPQLRIPKKADFESGEHLLRAMREVKGEVYAPRFGYLPLLAGKRTYAQRSMLDLVIFYDPVNGASLLNEVETAIRQKRFPAIIFESDIFRWMIDECYVETKPIHIKDTKFWAQDYARFVRVPK